MEFNKLQLLNISEKNIFIQNFYSYIFNILLMNKLKKKKTFKIKQFLTFLSVIQKL